MYCFSGRACFIFFLFFLSHPIVFAESRFALLIANTNYQENVGVLQNPQKDIDIIAQTLDKLGFEVTKVRNAGLKDFGKALSLHIAKVRKSSDQGAVISFFYYSGHGAADMTTKINYLIPVDVTDPSTNLLWGESINLQANVISALRAQAPLANHYVVIDACRNELKLMDQTKAVLVEGKAFLPSTHANGMLIAYTTEENRTTPDNGMYAQALASALLVKEDEIVVVFRNVQLEMQKKTGQSPFAVANNIPRTYFAKNGEENKDVAQPMAGPGSSLAFSEIIDKKCPEITVTDYSVFPSTSRIERRCIN